MARACGDDAVKAIVYVSMAKKSSCIGGKKKKYAKRRKELLLETSLLENESEVRLESPEMDESGRVHFRYQLQTGSAGGSHRLGI